MRARARLLSAALRCAALLAAPALGALACSGPAAPMPDAGWDAGPPSCDTPAACAHPGCGRAPFCTSCDGACGPCELCTRGRCETLPDGERCTGGSCHDGACCEGCWDGSACLAGDDVSTCGSAGVACEVCDGFSTCDAEGCTLPVEVGGVAGGDITCAIEASAIVCSGSNRLGQLAVGTTDPVTTPVPVAMELGTIVFADAADGLTCFVDRGGALGCAGANNFGQLGAGDTSDSSRARAVTGTQRIARVSVGATHVCALSRGGGLYCWGNNFYGQLGLGDTGPRRMPVRIGLDEDWQDIAVGLDHSCAIRGEAGELLCFGNDNVGQLGDGGTAPRSISVRVGEGYAQVSAGVGHTCAVRLDGELRCWGGSPHGQLGLGDTMLRRTPERVGDGYAQVSAGAGHTCAVRMDGTVVCFGENDDGELGTGASGADELTPVAVAGLTEIVRVETGSDHACATRADGSIVCWGANRSGQLGAATPAARAMPAPFPP